MRQYYYSIDEYHLQDLLNFLKDCQKRYKDAEIHLLHNMTMCWIKSNKDLYVPLNNSDLKFRYKELTSKPTPEKRWMLKWIDFQDKIKSLEIIASQV